MHARAARAPKPHYRNRGSYLTDLQRVAAAARERLAVADLDALFLRNDPSTDTGVRHWAQSVRIDFGRAALRAGVIVVNDPNGLARALNKMYLQLFPEQVRPRTLITRDWSEIRAFLREQGGRMVLKPVQGSGGRGVFLVESPAANLNQMVESLAPEGYVIAQEYLPAAAEGDTRLFVMNGEPLRHRGHFAAFRRVSRGEDMCSNIHAGGKLGPAEVTDARLGVVEIVRRPRCPPSWRRPVWHRPPRRRGRAGPSPEAGFHRARGTTGPFSARDSLSASGD